MSGWIDPQRNLLTTLLVGGIGTLLVVALAQTVLMGRVNVDRIAPVGDTEVDESRVEVPDTGLAEFEDYMAITRQPVFFSDRRLPVVELVEADEIEDIEPIEEPDDEPVEDLRAVVAGIIITPEMRMAMVRDEAAGKTMLMREGMSLEGEQAAWRIESIAARSASFVSVDGRSSNLELKVNTSGLTAGSPGQIRTPGSRRDRQPEREARDEVVETEEETEAAAETTEDDARARAEEVRRRVAERRAELRAEAERRAQAQQRQRRQDN
jgi:hypothetical protein